MELTCLYVKDLLTSKTSQNVITVLIANFENCYRDPVTRFSTSGFFSSNNSIRAPDTQVKAFLHMASYSRRYSTIKSTFFVVSGVNDTADHKSDP
jgi:hypothetical protein